MPAWAGPPPAAAAARRRPVEPGAGAWKTWVLASGSELRLPPPPDREATTAEIAELQALAAQRDGAALDRIGYWDAGAPGYRWNERACAQSRRLRGARTRMLALLNVAIYDATVAAWDSKYAYNRPRPAAFDASLRDRAADADQPVLPLRARRGGRRRRDRARLRLPGRRRPVRRLGGGGRAVAPAGRVAYPSDVAAGLALGRQVGAVVVERARRTARTRLDRQRPDRAGHVDRDEPDRADGRAPGRRGP